MSDSVTLVIGSECVIRPAGIRAHTGVTVEVSPEEYERLKKAECVDRVLTETATTVPCEAACRDNPKSRRAKGR